MSKRLEDFREEFPYAIAESMKFCNAARSREFQVEAIQRLEILKTRASALKTEIVANKDENLANLLLSVENMLQAVISELKMWVAFKDEDPSAAWTDLVGAQSAASTAMRAHKIAANLDAYIDRLHALEHLLFPPQLFFSSGIIIKRSTCSICGHEYGDCGHVKGKAYMGQMCGRIIKECDLSEISVVSNPANKHCRVISTNDGKVTRDFMTWRLIDEQVTKNSDVDDFKKVLMSNTK